MLGNRLSLFFLWCNRPYSRGRVPAASPDAAVAPRVDLNPLEDERDSQRLAAGARMLARVVDASPVPRLPSANTNMPAIAIAGKIADAMVARRRASVASPFAAAH